MSDKLQTSPLHRDSLSALVAAVPTDGFGAALLAHIRGVVEIANFGAFLVPDLADPQPVLSVWSGRMSDYWFNRNARRIVSHSDLRQEFAERILQAPPDGLVIERWQPPADDPRAPIYSRDKVIERVSVASRLGRGGFVSFYLRGEGAGQLSGDEMERLRNVLPMVHELVGLRHRISGTSGAAPSALRIRAVRPFAALSPREAEVCDHAVRGVSVAGTAQALGISENSVRTLRKRAWRKLGVASTTDLTALTLSSRG